MDKFQFKIMEELILDTNSNLTAEQFAIFSDELYPTIVNVPTLLMKMLYNRIALSGLQRELDTVVFIHAMNNRKW